MARRNRHSSARRRTAGRGCFVHSRQSGKLDSALVYYRQALAINQKLNRPEGMAYNHFNMGFLYEQLQDYATASIHFRDAFVYFNRLGSPYARRAVQGYQRMMAKLYPFFVGRVFLNSGEDRSQIAQAGGETVGKE